MGVFGMGRTAGRLHCVVSNLAAYLSIYMVENEVFQTIGETSHLCYLRIGYISTMHRRLKIYQ